MISAVVMVVLIHFAPMQIPYATRELCEENIDYVVNQLHAESAQCIYTTLAERNRDASDHRIQ